MAEHSSIQTRQIVRVYWAHTRPYLWVATVMVALVVAAKVLDVVVPLFYKRFFDLLAGDLPATSDTLPGLLTGTIVTVLILHLFTWLAWRSFALFSNWFQPRVMADLRQTAFDYLHGHSYRFFSNHFTGSLVRRVNRLADSFEALADQMVFNIIPMIVIVAGNLIVLWTRSHVLALILLAWVVLYIVINIAFALWKTRYDSQRAQLDSETTGVLADSLTNAITVKLFTGEVFELGLFKNITERLRKMHTFTWNIGDAMEAVQALLMTLIEFVIMYEAVGLWTRGLLTIGDFALIQAYLIGLFMVLWNVGRAIRKVYEALANADEMVEILNTPHEVKDARGAQPLQVQTGRIEFSGVYFSFNKTRRVLRDMNLVIKAKEKVALVGPSGAGKSTVTKLLFRFYDVERGKILIGNQNIAKVTQESLRESIALVPQEPILFHRSLMENIRYGRRDASDEEVIEAAKKARAHEFIEETPEGYQTFVGERGVKLSGGERQRVAIARAILKDAPILVLDEATSSLDSESEALIQEALAELMQDKTTIVIAHRLSTIMKMDRIVVIEHGQVVDSGSHAQLLRKEGGIYKKLWEIQAGGFIR